MIRSILFGFGDNGVASATALRGLTPSSLGIVLQDVDLLSGINFHLLDQEAKMRILESIETCSLSLNGLCPNNHDCYQVADFQEAVRALIRNFRLNGYEALVRVRNNSASAPVDYCDPITASPDEIMVRRNATGHAVLTIDGKDYIPGVDDTGLEISIVFLKKPYK